MKKILILLPALFAFALLRAQDATANTQPPADVAKYVDFKETDHDFGKIPQGKPAEFDLFMKNISSDSIRVDNVSVGCGCTTPKYEHGPYAPGETFKVTVGFNAGVMGPFSKVITIFFNGGISKVIHFHGETFAAAANAAPANASVQQLKPASN